MFQIGGYDGSAVVAPSPPSVGGVPQTPTFLELELTQQQKSDDVPKNDRKAFPPLKVRRGTGMRRRRGNPRAKMAMEMAKELRGRGYNKSEALKLAWQHI